MRIKIFKNKKSLPRVYRGGFALLYAILLTGTILVVGVLLMNIITKQLIYSSIGKNSETAYYYVANSIRECVGYNELSNDKFTLWDDSGLAVPVTDEPSFPCLGVDLVFSEPVLVVEDIYKYFLSNQTINIGGNNYLVDVDVYKNYPCENSSSCSGVNLYNKYATVIIVSGYSQSGPREVKRTTVLAR